VKSWRLWFLLLLAVLLPVRGAVAATMLCSVATPGVQAELLSVSDQATSHEAMDHAMSHDEHAGAHDHAGMSHDDGHAGHDHTTSGKCNMCSAYCALTPLASDAPVLAEPLGLTAVKVSDHSAPPPSFFSDGQERPPRTI
jgi:hypothetical protein